MQFIVVVENRVNFHVSHDDSVAEGVEGLGAADITQIALVAVFGGLSRWGSDLAFLHSVYCWRRR